MDGEQITEVDFAKLKAAWKQLQDGSGQIKISDTDAKGKKHAGFKQEVLSALGKLMSKPQGRKLVLDLLVAGAAVTIRPGPPKSVATTGTKRTALEKDGAKTGVATPSTIELEPGLTDDSVKAKDKDGKPLASPVFIVLGHELVHATHNAAGKNKSNQKASDGAYRNKEEEQTISTGSGVTENKIRAEHGGKLRYGHAKA